ncbi:MAG: cyclic nucleotide-binding domain-containing protein [Pseudomonadota bacterium]
MNTPLSEASSLIANPQMIQDSPLGRELSPEQCEKLAKVVAVLGLKDGEYLLEEAHQDEILYVIVDGRLEVVKCTALDDCVSLQLLKQGDMAGELGFIDGQPHSAGLRALSNCTVFSLEKSDLEAFLESDPQLVYKVMRAIIRTVHVILRNMNLQHVEMMNYISKQHGRY